MLTVTKRPLSYYVEKLQSDTPFSFVRYGDGEWFCMLGRNGETCDGQGYSAALKGDLHSSLLITDKNFIRAMGPLVLQGELNREVMQYLHRHSLNLQWEHTDVFLDAGIKGKLFPFVDTLRQKRMVYAGPAHLEKFFWEQFGVKDYIVVPDKNAYSVINNILEQVTFATERQSAEVVGFSAGPAAKVLVAKLWPRFGGRVTLLDLGSVWDGYVGKVSRSHVKKLTATAIAQNLGVKA